MKTLLLASLLILSGCQSHDVTIKMTWNEKTGVASGWVDNKGEITKVILAPSDMEQIEERK